MPSYVDPISGEEVTLTDNEYKALANDVLHKWEQQKKLLDSAKSAERTYRDQYVAMMSDPSNRRGTETIPLLNGYSAKVTKKETISFIKSSVDARRVDVNAVEAAQDEIEKLGNVGSVLADRLIKWKPEFSLSEYNKLDVTNETEAAIRKIVDRVIVVKPSAPELKIVAPK